MKCLIFVLRVFFAIAFCGMTVGWATSYFPEYAKARMSGALIFKMLREEPRIDGCSKSGLKTVSEMTVPYALIKKIGPLLLPCVLQEITGAIRFRNVNFSYPNRREIEVLRGL